MLRVLGLERSTRDDRECLNADTETHDGTPFHPAASLLSLSPLALSFPLSLFLSLSVSIFRTRLCLLLALTCNIDNYCTAYFRPSYGD